MTWLALLWFLSLLFLAPAGVTMPWDSYFMLFVPLATFAIAGFIGFALVRRKGARMSWFHAIVPILVLAGIYIVTMHVLRLRWHLIIH